MRELITWSFLCHERAVLFGGGDDALHLTNPLNQNMAVMRPSLLPPLLETLAANQRRGQHDVAFFEVGPSYGGTKPSDQRLVAGGVRTGSAEGVHFLASKRDVDIYDAKGDVETALNACGITMSNVQLSDKTPTWYHPGRAGSIMQGKNVLATFGELHPAILKAFDITDRVVGFEIFISAISSPKAKTAAKSSFTPSPFQAIARDFAFVVPSHVHADQIVRLMTKASTHPTTVHVFDVFCDQAMQDKGVKSLAFRVHIEPQDKTLTDEEITAISTSIIEQVKQTTGGELRA
jgi:phenylalanyl-tRNA synthetase beta chain